MGIPLGDLVGGINGPMGILAALYERSVISQRVTRWCGRTAPGASLLSWDLQPRISKAWICRPAVP
jgi:hypothetical protein